MPEPLTIATGVISIVFNCIKGLEIAKEYINKYNAAELKILELATETKALHLALTKIRDLFASNRFPKLQAQDEAARNAVSTFDEVFGSCSYVFSILYDRLKPLLSPSFKQDNTMAIKSKIAAVWKNSDIEQLISLVRGLIPAVQLLLFAFQTETVLETNKILTSNNANRILNRVASDTQSLVTTRREQSIAESTPDGESVLGDEEYPGLDDILVNSQVYRKVLQGHLRYHDLRNEASPSGLRQTVSTEELRSADNEDADTTTPTVLQGTPAAERHQVDQPAQTAPTAQQPTPERKRNTKSLYRNLFKPNTRRQASQRVTSDSASDSQVPRSDAASFISVQTEVEDQWEKLQAMIGGGQGKQPELSGDDMKQYLDDQVLTIRTLVARRRR